MESWARTEYLDHHIKFAAPLRKRYRADGNILWVGVRSNLEPLVQWVNTHSLPAPLDVLTNPEQSNCVLDPAEFGFDSGLNVHVHVWSPELQRRLTADARAAIDVKGDDFRSRHNPPAKALAFIASGLPLAMNPDSSAAEHLAGLGLNLAAPLDVERWLSRDYWEATRDLGRRLGDELCVDRVAQRLQNIIAEALTERRKGAAA